MKLFAAAKVVRGGCAETLACADFGTVNSFAHF